MTFLLVALFGLAGPSPDVSLKIQPFFVFPGGQIRVQIHVRYHESDRVMALEWAPDIVGNSTWTVTPEDRSTWTLWRRLDRPGEYVARASVGRGNDIRAFAVQRVQVIE